MKGHPYWGSVTLVSKTDTSPPHSKRSTWCCGTPFTEADIIHTPGTWCAGAVPVMNHLTSHHGTAEISGCFLRINGAGSLPAHDNPKKSIPDLDLGSNYFWLELKHSDSKSIWCLSIWMPFYSCLSYRTGLYATLILAHDVSTPFLRDIKISLLCKHDQCEIRVL